MAYSVAECVSKIQAIDTKKNQYDIAKNALITVKGNCQIKITGLQNSSKKINSGSKLGKVKVENNFEGEMATTLAKRVASFYTETQEAETQAEAIMTAIDTQITRINTEKSKLSSEREVWKNRLNLANAQL